MSARSTDTFMNKTLTLCALCCVFVVMSSSVLLGSCDSPFSASWLKMIVSPFVGAEECTIDDRSVVSVLVVSMNVAGVLLW